METARVEVCGLAVDELPVNCGAGGLRGVCGRVVGEETRAQDRSHNGSFTDLTPDM